VGLLPKGLGELDLSKALRGLELPEALRVGLLLEVLTEQE
jgi:hypothetical protein